ncbi:hypothetical protein M438DRAFT_70149 [Aureobasidium pullulans EXF-150]|uniref:Uncharacterized protein n=1 Tax=Aureobasidium pullulans EXF-150 TaxID=1043002 RepID=A0A074Y4D3_AURPU|nr:uncharacterized protein M438DRAFT_70149 [Aureobasidium pullulans EXF-150]KEQ81771.1 hypothetical protein M438DRAFT_70149 [Aureobasidium pullulans EXF-150]
MSCKPLSLLKSRTMSILACTLHRFVFLFCLCLVLVSSSFPMTPSCCDGCLVIYCRFTAPIFVYSREKPQPLRSLSTKEQHSTAQSAENEKGKHVENFRTYGTTPTTKPSATQSQAE